jgi:hypothetical protein
VRGAPEFRRQVVGQALDDDGVGSERHVRPVLLARSDRDDEPLIAMQDGSDLGGPHLFQPARGRRRRRGLRHLE